MNCWNQPPELRDELSRRSQDYRQRLEDMKQAGLRTCRDSGIHRPSAVMAERPGVLRDMAIIKDTSQRYQFTSEIGADDDAFNDGVMFDYSDDTYIKTIGEPFPTGFPAQTAIQIAEDYLSTCQDLSERTENTDWQSHRQTGLNALRLAQLRLHSVTPEDVYRFIDRMQNILPPDSEMVSHIMRLITGRDTQAQDLLLAHGLQTVPMTSDNNTNRIIKAARRAGFKKPNYGNSPAC